MSTKQPQKQTLPKQTEQDKSIGATLAVGAFILPFATWLVAGLLNPSGWASDDPTIVILMLALLALEYWLITLMVVIIFIAACFMYRKPKITIIGTFLMVISVLYSAFLFHFVWTADDSEFAG